MDYKRGQNTHDQWREASAAPFAPDQAGGMHDPNPGASWNTGEAAVHATTWDTRLEADGTSLTTRVTAGPANAGGDISGPVGSLP